jgi:hypothetical protein
MKLLIRNYFQQKEEAPSKLDLGFMIDSILIKREGLK